MVNLGSKALQTCLPGTRVSECERSALVSPEAQAAGAGHDSHKLIKLELGTGRGTVHQSTIVNENLLQQTEGRSCGLESIRHDTVCFKVVHNYLIHEDE